MASSMVISRLMDPRLSDNTLGAITLAQSNIPEYRELAREYVQRLWDVKPPTGKFRYYEGLVYFLSMLHVSGRFSLDF